MSGHSKWHNIRHKKAKEDAKKGLIFTKVGKEISVAVKHGGPDPASNTTLRLLLEKARSHNMPKDNIERALKKGSGNAEGVMYEETMYEGYAPDNVAVIVEALTDNKNRTASDLRHVFSRNGGRLVDAGSVSWMFDRRGVVSFSCPGKTEEMLLEQFLDIDLIDLSLSDGLCNIVCMLEDLDKTRIFAEKLGYVVKSADPAWIAKTPTELDESSRERVVEFLDKLEDLDDVKDIFVSLA